MAFRVPTHAPPQRQQQHTYPTAARPSSIDTTPQNQEDEDSQEWVLFSPSQTTSNDFTHTSSTERTPRTAAGLSRFSDFGSLETAARSLGTDDDGDEPEDDGTELDSLDDGLPAFREPATLSNNRPSSRRYGGQSDPAILPTHDGLGTFQASSQSVQDHLWQHELNNPRRRHGERARRQSSVQRRLDTVDESEGPHLDHDRWQRIEAWRMEQSRALLHEIEKETRRRRRRNSRASMRSGKPVEQDGVDVTGRKRPKLEVGHTASQSPDAQDQNEEEETFWTRITRKVIKELMGIDDSLLSVIFGESLPQEDDAGQQHPEGEDQTRSQQEKLMSDINSAAQGDGSWQDKLLERIARELGILVHQICEHPGAFSTYLRSSTSAANEYAGIPVSHPSPSSSSPRPPQPLRSTSDNSVPHSSTHSPHFFPTLQDTAPTHESLWGIEEEEDYPFTSNPRTGATLNASGSRQDDTPESIRLRQEREYWERQLDVNMVFQYLRSRFGKGKANPNPPPTSRGRHPQPSHSTSPNQDLSHRAAIIRQNHPLVARAHARSQTQFQHQLQIRTVNSGNMSSPSSPIRHHQQHIRRASSSCASQSSKVSISTSRTLGVGSGSSRNYWDIGGSVGSGRRGAAVVSVGGGSLAGGVGSWGEV